MAFNEIAVRDHAPATVRLSAEQLQYIAHTEFVPKSMRGNLPAILACVATGRALGLSDMSSLRSINIIDGKAAFSAELMVSLVRERGHSIQGNFSGDSCTVTGKRADNGDEIEVTWTRQMALDAGLANKNNWKSFPASMLWARAASQLCRMLFADCFSGATHTPEELDGADFEDGEFAEVDAPALEMVQPIEQAADEPAPPAAMLKKLNVLVGTLREAGHIETEHLYKAVGREPVVSEDGELHWSPLRDSLSKAEAHALIERLSALEARVGETVT